MNKEIKKSDKSIKKAVVKKTAKLKVEKSNNKPEKKIDNFVRAVGRRKSSAARVRLYSPGKGKIEINGKDFRQYFRYFELYQKVTAPLKSVGKIQAFDFTIKVVGGGLVGQADACRHGIARALVKFNEEDYKRILRVAGYLTRDPRVKERKKPGLKKARRAPQWSKR